VGVAFLLDLGFGVGCVLGVDWWPIAYAWWLSMHMGENRTLRAVRAAVVEGKDNYGGEGDSVSIADQSSLIDQSSWSAIQSWPARSCIITRRGTSGVFRLVILPGEVAVLLSEWLTPW
jgi:hypothetical protein